MQFSPDHFSPQPRSARALPCAAGLLVLLLLLQGCSFAFKFGYNRADWLITGQVDDYVNLSDSQQTLFDERFERLWRWHRHEELPAYAQDLREFAAGVEAGLSADDIARFRRQSEGYWERVVRKALPDLTALASSLDDEQVRDLLAEVDSKRAEYAEKWAKPPAAKARQRARKDMLKLLQKRIGSLSDEQAQLVQQWSQDRHLTEPLQAESRRLWRDRLANILQRRDQTGLAADLAGLLINWRQVHSPELARKLDDNDRLRTQLLTDIAKTASTQQRLQLIAELLKYASDFEALAKQKG